MNAIRGRVRGGHVEIDEPLPDGAEVVVLAPAEDTPFELDDTSNAELESRMAELDRGETVPGETVFDGLRRGR
jgi:hypothetical protein